MAATALLLSTGCWDRKEVNDLAIVTTAGLDRNKDGDIELSLEIVVPSEKGGGTQTRNVNSKSSDSTLMLSASGATSADAVSKLQIKLSRTIYWGQLEMLVFGDTLSRSQLREQLDYFVRNSNIRLRVQPFVCKGTAHDFLAFTSPLERNKADFLGGESKRLFRKPITLNHLVQNLDSDSKEAVIPYVDTTQNDKASVPYVKGFSVFFHDRMAGLIQGESFSGMKWILKQMRGDIETVKLESPTTSLLSLEVLSSSTLFVPTFEGEIPHMDILIEAEMSIVQNATRFETMDPKFIRDVEDAAVDKIHDKVETAIKQAQGIGADIFGFGEVINRQNPRKWEELQDRWERVYPSIQADVKVGVKIRQIGMNNKPIGES